MPLEDIKRIAECERKSQESRTQTMQEARKLAATAEREGRELAEGLKNEAVLRVKGFMEGAEKTAAHQSDDITAKAGKECDILKKKAEDNLEKAANFIVERIVNA